MKYIVNILSSLKLTLVLLMLVAIWFASGTLLSVTSQYGHFFRSLNHQLIWKSLFELPHIPTYHWSPLFNFNKVQHDLLIGLPNPEILVKTWLWGIFILGILLIINLLLGCKDWFFDLFKKRSDLRRVCLLTMHLVFVIVLLAHFISSVSGLKISGQMPVKKGQSLRLQDGYQLHIDNILSYDDWKDKKNYWTPDGFRYTKTKIKFSLFKEGKSVFTGQLTEFEPVIFKSFHITLTPFSFRSQVSHDFLSTGTGERIVVHNNPGLPVMLIFQPIWIVILLVYTFLILIRSKKKHYGNTLQIKSSTS